MLLNIYTLARTPDGRLEISYEVGLGKNKRVIGLFEISLEENVGFDIFFFF